MTSSGIVKGSSIRGVWHDGSPLSEKGRDGGDNDVAAIFVQDISATSKNLELMWSEMEINWWIQVGGV